MEFKIYTLKEAHSYLKEKLVNRGRTRSIEVMDKVTKIVSDVRKYGDAALIAFTKEFDRVELTPESIKVSIREIENAYSQVSKEFINAIKLAKANIEKFHTLQLKTLWFTETSKGIFVGQKYAPISSVGIYVPGGRASYPSTVLMAGIPAKVAGVSEIVLCSPPDLKGGLPPPILVAANEIGITKIFKVGGAQAIAAMAYGTETIPRVEKIVGPGNIYVTTAKLIVSSDVRIDLPAGPSEILILADASANPSFIACDLMAQAEHDPNAYCILLSDSNILINNVIEVLKSRIPCSDRREIIERALDSNSLFIQVANMGEALSFINDFAPEHLELMVKDPFKLIPNIRNSGAIFLGEMSPVALGDLIAGSNHILPTGGYAKTYSGLSVNDFLKSIDLVYATKEGLKGVSDALSKIAESEKLLEHKKSVDVRLKDER
ncbi:MAG: histidinol dehydrogenase [Candidatus Odinarchaeum yellowstonii]|uniref:Histidinol dehydrogenase n=1 Tax=Odinarchaeota yellowstonii (strain LCB_4) TaxID=1841599 RepID=A0AAF0IA95_ODILC|nr:MAG: histidinol dehydrogenase [Candidatus Odinarchaeum yellowstonii]